MNITFVTSAQTDDESRELLRLFGMPFKVVSAGNRNQEFGVNYVNQGAGK